MAHYLNEDRPPVYCPGCTHDTVTRQLDKALSLLGLEAEKTVIVSDIGCSGLFDTFFNVHALHGLHGRALSYGAGLKLADPELTVIVTMGDGGLGIGGAHLLAACRRNLDMTLIMLNNFNFGMTGGQYSATTPTDALAASEFLNQAEIPLDICSIAESSGATYLSRCSGLAPDLAEQIAAAISHAGFSIIETLGVCPGRFSKRNKLTPSMLQDQIDRGVARTGLVEQNQRPEYGAQYRKLAASSPPPPEEKVIEPIFKPLGNQRQEVIMLGSAGMRVVTAGDLLCYAGMSAGMHISQKNDYNITVLRGQSVSEIILSPKPIGYTGINSPSVVIALSDEGVVRRKTMFPLLSESAILIRDVAQQVPETTAHMISIDFQQLKISQQNRALASLGVLARCNLVISREMLEFSLKARFSGDSLMKAMEIITIVYESDLEIDYPDSLTETE
ncbi:MAG: 2-oxoglutarate synthase [Desulfobulbaceae bacterium]|nr:MAG: 2-oxoglutarate synthase [Desulfobulbaceae bacterium]